MDPVRTTYRAPWSRELAVLSAVGMLGIAAATVFVFRRGGLIIGTLLALSSAWIISTTVRGYHITADSLEIRRLFWTTRWPLARPTTASVRPQAMARSFRLWGNGGLLSFSGHFSNAQLGRYRAFVTDFDKTVILETPRGLVVVSPDDPAQFAAAVTATTRPPAARAGES